MAISQDNIWLIVFLMTVISAWSLLLQRQVVLLFQIWQQHQLNLRALKKTVTTWDSTRTPYRRMKLRYVLFLVQKARRKNR